MSSEEETPTRFEGYSDYESVSRSVTRSVDNAVEAYASIRSMHAQNDRISRNQASEASSHILSASIKLLPELEANEEAVDECQEILQRWTDGTDGDEDLDGEEAPGYITRVQRVQLRDECPEWLHQFVVDIRRAGWELGYLQAGRTERADPEDPIERDSENMFGGV